LTLTQRVPPTPGQPNKKAMHIPVRLGLLSPDGTDLPLKLEGSEGAPTTRLLELREAEQTFTFVDVPARPSPSLLRGFSAPVRLESDCTDADLLLRMAHDSDSYCRWDAAQSLAQRRIMTAIKELQRGATPALDDAFIEAFGGALASDAEPQLLAVALSLPGESVISDRLEDVDPTHVHHARNYVEGTLARAHKALFERRYEQLGARGAYSLDTAAIGQRSLRNLCLRYLTVATDYRDGSLARAQLEAATNMTDMIAALACLANVETRDREQALAQFYERFQGEALVVDKWFSVQATAPRPRALDDVSALLEHPAFEIGNPNRARSLIDAFANGNPVRFHDASGRGYRFLRDRVLEIDAFNGQVSARMVGPLTRFQRYEPRRRARMVAELEAILGHGSLSRDLEEQVRKAVDAAHGR
ncbi:MAG TPA: DUF3458 domain-containing protein, partial [Polyangiales bacterium]|nr:DUF3458 domain-containing protein [Polyangiales bacterium]